MMKSNERNEVTVRGVHIELTAIEYGILELMLKSPSKIFSTALWRNSPIIISSTAANGRDSEYGSFLR